MSRSSIDERSSIAVARLSELEDRDQFVRRHIGPRSDDIQEMLKTLGFGSLDELVDKAIPASIRSRAELPLPPSRPEHEALSYLRRLAAQNQPLKPMIGLGYSGCITPPVILRNILENPGWYTAYTPYQAEISQGRLEALLNFQTMITDLTGMEIANASLLDEGTAAAEAMSMCHSIQGNPDRKRFWVSRGCHPQTIEVVGTRAKPLGIELVIGDLADLSLDGSYFGILFQCPDTEGGVFEYADLVERAHAGGAMVTVAADLLSMALFKPPGEFGADIVVGSSQRFGVPLGFGGPHAAFFATREAHSRRIPGRMVGVSQDAAGNYALRLALQTREQHIRREKATSNICTAQVLLAVMASMYAVYHGPGGIQRIARRVHRLACILAEGFKRLDFRLRHQTFFDTVTVEVGSSRREEILERARQRGINFRAVDSAAIGVSLDETSSASDIQTVWECFDGLENAALTVDQLDQALPASPPAKHARASLFLTHPVFNSHRSETEMLRYLHRLQEKDLSLTKSMIPLGSCTMKLNATAEMLTITHPGFADMHPFAPLNQATGYLTLIEELSAMLRDVTGFHGVSLQPNAGSQGEYVGLLIIRAYHESRGEGHRDVCLIPSSAHGTNPASAAMAGLKVVVVSCDSEGNIDTADLEAKVEKHRQHLAALMITYPSTHGVFEEGIVQICQLIHQNGGQVYMDGANLNALVGLCLPGAFGPDVAHLNLHKTFCIPHGGGGPGVGPIGVAKHLTPFLPKHCLTPEAGPLTGISAAASAPWGSAGILPISWAYIALMGRDGLKQATQVAILNANYVAARLAGHYPILYKGRNGLVAHECIVDLRPLKAAAGVDVDDVAKRLMDYGFHAPTMSFPVAGTLMIEPTESESKEELDRFCDAMIGIRQEIREIEKGLSKADDNPLKNAPHTVESLTGEWPHGYSRQQAVFPLPWVRERKFWPPVARIDNTYGDRHLMCTCPPIESYQDS